MKSRLSVLLIWLVILSLVTSAALVGCTSEDKTAEPEVGGEAKEEGKVVNRASVTLPADAAPLGSGLHGKM